MIGFEKKTSRTGTPDFDTGGKLKTAFSSPSFNQ
jgi:hypothetical protein